MFDSVLDRAKGARSRFGTGAVISVGVHAGLVALAVYLSSAPAAGQDLDAPKLVFLRQPSLPPPPAAAPRRSNAPQTPKKVRKDVLVAPSQLAVKPPELEDPPPSDADPDDGAQPDGQPGGQLGGVPGGDPDATPGVGAVGGEPGGTQVLPFGEGMTRPDWHQAAARDPIVYTREAREALVEGTLIVKCVVTTEGRLSGCRILKPLPFMERAVLETMARWQVPPVTFQGRPVPVEYTFNVTLTLPR